MTLATDLYLRLSEEESIVSNLAGSLGQVTTAFGNVVSRLVEESPSLSKFFPSDLASQDLSVEPVTFSIGGYHLALEFVGLLNKPFNGEVGGELDSEVEVDNGLNLIVDMTVVRDGADVPFVATIGLPKVGGQWEEYIPTLEGSYEYETIGNLETWIESFLHASLIEFRYVPGSFDVDSDLLIDELIDGDMVIDTLN